MRPTEITLAYAAADPNGIALSQAVGAAGNLVLAGVLVSSGVATLTPAGHVTVTSGGDDTGITFAVYGTSPEGWIQQETMAGVNGGAATTTLSFKTVTRIAASGAVATVVEAGTVAAGYTQWIPIDIYNPNQATTVSVDVTGTVNYDVQFTNDDPFDPTGPHVAFSHPTAALVGGTADQYGSSLNVMRALRLKMNSSTPPGQARMVITQQSTQ